MAIEDLEMNFEMIQESKKISCERKKQLFRTFLQQIESIFFKSPDYENTPEKEDAKNLYRRIQNYINK